MGGVVARLIAGDAMSALARQVTSLSAYRRAEEHLTNKTVSGAIVTIVGVLAASILLVHESGSFFTKDVVQEMVVDSVRGENLILTLNISVLSIPCSIVSVTTVDEGGQVELNLQYFMNKEILDKDGAVVSKYTDDNGVDFNGHKHVYVTQAILQGMIDAKVRGEGCRLSGNVKLQKLSGTFHISTNAMNFGLLLDLFGTMHDVNTSHVIHQVAAGPSFPKMENPLDDYNRVTTLPGSFKYFLKLVPTEYVYRNGRTIHTFQYSVTEYFTKNEVELRRSLPGIHFKYDMSAIAVKLREKKVSWLHFFVRICATIGGTFALTKFMNTLMYTIHKK